LDYPLLSDTDTKVAAAYGILRGKRSRRTTIFVDIAGKIAHIESKVDVRNHGNQIVEQLKNLKFPLKGNPDESEDRDELGDLLKAVTSMLLEADKNQDGQITQAEGKNLSRLFELADTNQNGTIEKSELDSYSKRITDMIESRAK
jgi:hypothetical protein